MTVRAGWRRLAVACLLGGAMLLGDGGDVRAQSTGVIEEAPVGGPFELVDEDGRTVTERSWPGKYLLVFFGYRFCPDFCPTELDKWGAVLEGLGADADKIQPLFISIDPKRDTAEALKDYTSVFDPRIIGLTGTPEQVKAAAMAYRVYYAPSASTLGQEENYLMDHSTYSYLMAPDGRNLLVFSWEAAPEVMVEAIRAKLAGS